MITVLATISLLHWVVLITPGANVLLVSQLAASGQQRSAFFAGLGISVVAVTWAVLALLGVRALFAALPQLRIALQIAGALYLTYVAIRLWRSGGQNADGPSETLNGFAAFRLGFLTNIMNPKSALFFGGVFSTALPVTPEISLTVAAVIVVFFNALCWHTFLAFAFSRPRVRVGYANHRKTLNRTAGLIVGAIGVRMLSATAYELRKQ